MENRDRTANQGGPQGGSQKPGQGGGQQGGGQKTGQGENRSTTGNEWSKDQGMRTGKSDFEIEGGREGAGEIPNPENDSDRGSRSGFRGNAAEESALDADQSEEGFGKNVNRNKDQNNPLSNPK